MESLLEQLRFRRSIPYISKKIINDTLTELVMRRAEPSFYAKIYRIVGRVTRRFVVVKGGIAIRALLEASELDAPSADLDLQIDIPQCRFSDALEYEAFVRRALNLQELHRALKAAAHEHEPAVRATLEKVTLRDLIKPVRTPFVMFKSYVNEAVVVPDDVDAIRFELNEAQPLKMTLSMINDEHFLVRFSFNVLVKSHNMYECHERDRTRPIAFFPLDVYFLDVTAKPFGGTGCRFVPLFDTHVAVDAPDRIVAEQLECLFYNVFYLNAGKTETCKRRILSLIDRFGCEPSRQQRDNHRALLEDKTSVYCARDVKELLYRAGPRLGAELVARFYFEHRFVNSVSNITYQINFPYHIWDNKYFSQCWKTYLRLLDEIFALNLTFT